jgi:hypothetical protein
VEDLGGGEGAWEAQEGREGLRGGDADAVDGEAAGGVPGGADEAEDAVERDGRVGEGLGDDAELAAHRGDEVAAVGGAEQQGFDAAGEHAAVGCRGVVLRVDDEDAGGGDRDVVDVRR